MNNQNMQLPDVKAVLAQARQEWEQKQSRQINIQERVASSIPYWLIAIAVVFYLLSAPHTAATFDLLTPGWGFAAPIGVEAGIVFAAFRRYQLRIDKRTIPLSLRAIGWLMAIVSVVVNGAGTFTAVISAVGLSSLSLNAIANQFGSLPATAQVGLLLVPLAAVAIPLSVFVAGEGMSALILEQRERGKPLDQRWKLVRLDIEYTALRNAMLRLGHDPDYASEWSYNVLHRKRRTVSKVSAVSETKETQKTRRQTPEAEATRRWMTDNPTRAKENHRIIAGEIGVSPSTVYRIQREFSPNGHDKSDV